MNARERETLQEERGFTALETAIILMAFIVVASVFAFTILSSGMSSTEESKKAIEEGMSEVQGSLEIRGSVIATGAEVGTDNPPTETVTSKVDEISFCVANVAGGSAIDMNSGTDRTLIIDYATESTHQRNVTYTIDWQGYTDGDNLLEERELAEITVPLSSTNGITLTANTDFVLEVKPEKGGVLPIQRSVPADIDAVMDLG